MITQNNDEGEEVLIALNISTLQGA